MKKKKNVEVTKASGQTVPFLEEKLRNSLLRSGAGIAQVNDIIQEISNRLYQGISTKKIYRLAFNILKERSKHLAARYHLKRAIMELGPSGYPFEKYIGEILKVKGYIVQTGVYLKGKCVNHEVDVLAYTDHHQYMVECKYHNQQGIVCDVKIPLYIQSRFNDIEAQRLIANTPDNKIHKGWVVTNTKFSSDAIKYSICVGLELLGWDYPNNRSLKDIIDESGLYPVTCLTTLTRAEKQKLLDNNVILCKEISVNEKILRDIGMSEVKSKRVIEEGQQLCHILTNRNKQ